MSPMYKPYVVKQGDYLSAIASSRGLSAQAIWDSPMNREVRHRRTNPQILLVGDVVWLPEEHEATRRAFPHTVNRFVVRLAVGGVSLRLVENGRPLSNEPYVVKGGPSSIRGTTTNDGFVNFQIPLVVRSCVLELTDRVFSLNLDLGALNPSRDRRGLIQRLVNLGYLLSDGSEPDDAHLSAVVRIFQKAIGVDETGVLDAETAKQLEEAHGS